MIDAILKNHPQFTGKTIRIKSWNEIDQTQEVSRSFYKPSNAFRPPLLPLDYARAEAEKKKRREFAAMLKKVREEEGEGIY
jgi:hypothetical protein